MTLIVNLDVVLAKRKMRMGDLARAIGITQANLSILKTGKAKAIRFSTLDAICRHLDVYKRQNHNNYFCDNNFMPSIGKINYMSKEGGNGIREDSGIEQGDEISVYYDSVSYTHLDVYKRQHGD